MKGNLDLSRVALANMTWGFFLLFVAACGGAFVALHLTEAFMSQNVAPNWQSTLQTSSHGHTSLFGIIHVLLGLTIPYDGQTNKIRVLKSIALFCGSFAMGPLMLMRSAFGPAASTSWTGILVGVALAVALFGVLSHSVDLFRRLAFRG